VEAVNVLGSLFYGGMLGVFVLAFFFKRVTARGALIGVVVGQLVIFACWKYTALAFLWYNVSGCGVVVVTAIVVSALIPEVTLAKSKVAPIASE
jgi:Na+/proline symporter